MEHIEPKQPTLLENYIEENPEQLERVKARYRAKRGKSALLLKELLKLYQPLVDADLVKHRINKSTSFRVTGEYIQVAYRIAIRASDGKWQGIDDGKESIKREFENFARRVLVVERFDEIRAYVDALRVKPGEAAYSVPDLTSIWGKR